MKWKDPPTKEYETQQQEQSNKSTPSEGEAAKKSSKQDYDESTRTIPVEKRREARL